MQKNKRYTVISGSKNIFDSIIKDILSSKSSIYLETYLYGNDKIGIRFRDALIKKAKQGVKIKILIDKWGSEVNIDFFKELIELGGEVKFFAQFIYSFNFLKNNHRRDHRKIFCIDDKISYIGSINITERSLDSRELVLRIEGRLSYLIKDIFNLNWNLKPRIVPRFQKIKSLCCTGFELILDIPSIIIKPTEKKYLQLIDNAKRMIRIETPYFFPPNKIIRGLLKAAKRGIKVQIILPLESDIKILDLLRDTYFGKLYRKGVEIYFYTPGFLHSKMMVIDDNRFLVGSSNVDFRSFWHQFEINLYGKNEEITKELYRYSNETLKSCRRFNYIIWKNRSWVQKLFGKILKLIEYWL